MKQLTHPIYEIASKVADELGLNAYAVGGVVRDLVMNRKSKDIDIVVVGSGIAFAKAVANAISPHIEVSVFKNFGTARFRFADTEIEFVGARRESYQSNSRKPAVEDGTLQDDLNRRDFTVNALAIPLNGENKGEILDCFGGLQDISAKIIRTPLDPDVTFSDDPLRMMRAVRFASQLGFSILPETFEAIQRNAARLEIISKERIIDEFNKILLSPRPSWGINLLKDSGLLQYFLPELLQLQGVEIVNGRGHKDNYLHTMEVVDTVASVSTNLWLIWAALLHDIGKPTTKRYDEKIGWTFHSHEFVGSKMVGKIFSRLKMPTTDHQKYVQKLVLMHLRPIALVEDVITDSAVRRLLFEAGDDIDDLMLLCNADITSKNAEKRKRYAENFVKVQKKLIDIEEKDRLRNFQPPVDGMEIMEVFGIGPSKEVGVIKEAIRNAILEGVIGNNHDEAYQLMLTEGKKLGLLPR
ncbi:MAG: CCA tRNA nucleotidyltransferase [Bacteroidales bacterium]|nr:CCA tRNA nucleotidyltransferase [Bacteroidales bacterium]MCQ2271045.1 CCA tRNA nucleotidyltransferase [Bacteroidales bacterium]